MPKASAFCHEYYYLIFTIVRVYKKYYKTCAFRYTRKNRSKNIYLATILRGFSFISIYFIFFYSDIKPREYRPLNYYKKKKKTNFVLYT